MRSHNRFSSFLVSFTAFVLAGCATPPEKLALVNPQATALQTSCAICLPCSVCTPPSSTSTVKQAEPFDGKQPASEAAGTFPDPARGRLERSNWQALPNWGTDDPSDALAAFLQGCPMLKTQPAWADVCAKGAALQVRLDARTDTPTKARTQTRAAANKKSSVTQFFEAEFEPYQTVNADNSQTGVVTGYYEPLLRGSRTPTPEFRYPLYASPQDLISIDLSEVYPELKNRRLRGRLVGNKLIPYYDRAAIESESQPLRGLEIAWVDDSVESFFLQIQGSGQIQLPDGTRMRIGYADQNGHPFKSVAGALIRKRELKIENASMQGIKAWAERNPSKVRQFMNVNPSYVFFKELPGDLSGPIGTLGVPLTAERSIAVDQRVIPLGVPVYLSTTLPLSKEPMNRLVVAQDTGGAIFGAVRADFYFGFGDAAGNLAGRMKQQGRMWVLLPRGYDPNAPVTPSPGITPTIPLMITPVLAAPQTAQ